MANPGFGLEQGHRRGRVAWKNNLKSFTITDFTINLVNACVGLFMAGLSHRSAKSQRIIKMEQITAKSINPLIDSC